MSEYYLQTIAGSGLGSYSGDGGPASSASFKYPCGIWGDSNDNLYIADINAYRIRKITASNSNISSFIGSGLNTNCRNGIGGSASSVNLCGLWGLYGDSINRYLYFSDENYFIWRYSFEFDNVTRYGGAVPAAYSYGGDGGPATSAYFQAPLGLFLSSTGMLYVADCNNNRIRVINTANGIVNTFAGDSNYGFSRDGVPANSTSLWNPRDIFGNTMGVMYIADTNNNRIRMVNSSGIIFTIAGNGNTTYNGDNIAATSATIYFPTDVKQDTAGNIYIADYDHCRIRMISTLGIITTIIGGSQCTTATTSIQLASSANIMNPNALWIDSIHDIYFTDTSDYLRKIFFQNQPTSIPLSKPSSQPTTKPSTQPSVKPTRAPMNQPSSQPSEQPSAKPTSQPTMQPTSQPSEQPTNQPTIHPTSQPSSVPSERPTGQPSTQPSEKPTRTPSSLPTVLPSAHPSAKPTLQPTSTPSMLPSTQPTATPSNIPSRQPSSTPTMSPTSQPTAFPSTQPSTHPSTNPSSQPSTNPTESPLSHPSSQPSISPTSQPSNLPSPQPSSAPSDCPTKQPSSQPSSDPSSQPSSRPSQQPSNSPSSSPTTQPSSQPSLSPSSQPSSRPSSQPSALPSIIPSTIPTNQPIPKPSSQPSAQPSVQPITMPTVQPSGSPSSLPSIQPSSKPSSSPSAQPSVVPSRTPSRQPSSQPSSQPSTEPSNFPTDIPTIQPTTNPTTEPSEQPSGQPTLHPTAQPSSLPSSNPSRIPTSQPCSQPSSVPSISPSSQPSIRPTAQPTDQPSMQPSNRPSSQPSICPSERPTNQPSNQPTSHPSIFPSSQPSSVPSNQPTSIPSCFPSRQPSSQPSVNPSNNPSTVPSLTPSSRPSSSPTSWPSNSPTNQPSSAPTYQPSTRPTAQPSYSPTSLPSIRPVSYPSSFPSCGPSSDPSAPPSSQPTKFPLLHPSSGPSTFPSAKPSNKPSTFPSTQPISDPTSSPSFHPTWRPSLKVPSFCSANPTVFGSNTLSSIYSKKPTFMPTFIPSITPTATLMTATFNSTAWKEVLCLIGVYSFTHVYETFTKLEVFPREGLSYILFGSLSQKITNTALAKWPTTYRRDVVSRAALIPGDLNGDGWNDLFLCNPIISSCYIFYGTKEGITNVHIGATIYGTSSSDYFGFSLALVGNMNKDGLIDMIVCALSKKACYVLYGGSSSWPQRLMISEMTNGYQIVGDSSSISLMGLSVTGLGDMNDDGYDDIAISVMTSVSSASNVVYVIYGNGEGEEVLLSEAGNGIGGFKVIGEAGYYTGFSISGVGDVNGDGLADLAIGKLPYPGTKNVQSTIIIFGSREGGDVILSSSSGIEEDGGRVLLVEGGGGFIVSGIGDINHDGFADVLLSASYDYVGESNAYIVTYPTDITSPPTMQPSSSPSLLPSATPSFCPSSNSPSHSPSPRYLEPLSNLSVFPTSVDATRIPSKLRTTHPSQSSMKSTNMPSTSKPVFKTSNPSLLPSFPPSKALSNLKSFSPSFRPSPRPSQPCSSFQPSSSPTSMDSNQSTAIVILSGGQYFGSSGKEIFNIQGTGNIEIEGGGGGTKVYIIYLPPSPTNKTVVTITDFNIQRDMINLQYFPAIQSVNDISFSENPLTMYLTKNVKVICSSLKSIPPNQIQFIFAVNGATDDSTNSFLQSIEDPSVIAALGIIIICALFVAAGWNRSSNKKTSDPSDDKEEDDDDDDEQFHSSLGGSDELRDEESGVNLPLADSDENDDLDFDNDSLPPDQVDDDNDEYGLDDDDDEEEEDVSLLAESDQNDEGIQVEEQEGEREEAFSDDSLLVEYDREIHEPLNIDLILNFDLI